MTVLCWTCGNRFEPDSETRRFCSTECWRQWDAIGSPVPRGERERVVIPGIDRSDSWRAVNERNKAVKRRKRRGSK